MIVANALNVAADLVAVGSGTHLLYAGPATVWAPLAGLAITELLLTGSFEFVARIFKLLCLALFSYIAAGKKRRRRFDDFSGMAFCDYTNGKLAATLGWSTAALTMAAGSLRFPR